MAVMTVISPTVATSREAAREDSGRFGEQHHAAPELTLETEAEAAERGIQDARGARAANPGAHIDEYMAGYESELLDLGDSWED